MTGDAVQSETAAARRLPAWSELIGHDQLRQWFAAAIASDRLGGSFLLTGMPGIGKRTVARVLAQTLLCETTNAHEMAPCGRCPGCVQVAAGSHPDLVTLRKPTDRSYIPLELLIGPPDARGQAGFCREIRLRPMSGRRKVAILEDADFLNEEGANCLLKTLEEPPPGTVILLIGSSEQRQLPTIRSRCRIIRMGPLSRQDALRLLRTRHGIEAGDDAIIEAVEIAGGDLTCAAGILTENNGTFRRALSEQLSADLPDPVALAGLITRHVEAAGKDAALRRGVLRDALAMSLQFYRRRMRQEATGSVVNPLTMIRLDRSIRALREVDRNANQSTLIECFASDIALGATGDRGEIG